MHPDLLALLQRLAARRQALPLATFAVGANAIASDRHHLIHPDGETIALLRELGERASELAPAVTP